MNCAASDLWPGIGTKTQELEQEEHPQSAVNRLLLGVFTLELYRVGHRSKETLRCGKSDVRVCLATEQAKSRDAELELIGR